MTTIKKWIYFFPLFSLWVVPYSSWPPIHISQANCGTRHSLSGREGQRSVCNKQDYCCTRMFPAGSPYFFWDILVKEFSCCKWIMILTEQCPVVMTSELPFCYQLGYLCSCFPGEEIWGDSLDCCRSSFQQGRILSPDTLQGYWAIHPDVFFHYSWNAVPALGLMKD